MTAYDVTLRALAADVKIALVFYTRLPLVHPGIIEGAHVARAGWAAPVVGGIVGLFGALVYWLAFAVGLPGFTAAGLALAATIAATGALHEDGLPTRRMGSAAARPASASSKSCATAASACMAPAR